MRPLEAAARKRGVEILLGHRMTGIHREKGDAKGLNAYPAGRVVGIEVTHRGATLNIRAKKAVIIATGGSTGNVDFRRMFDPRLTEEYCGLAGMPWSDQDASGELAAMAIGASLWGLANQTAEFGAVITKPGRIGSQWGYVNLNWQPGSKIFDKIRATGLRVSDWQNVITVNMLGKRFYDETCKQFTRNNYNAVKPYVHGHYLNAETVKYKPNNWLNAAMQGIGDGKNGGGPIWAIFDSDACAREKWDPNPPYVDEEGGFFFRADTIEELAATIKMKHQRLAMPPGNLRATVTNYNTFVFDGVDSDFGKPSPKYPILKPPFYAAWCTPVVHDTRAGLRIDAGCQVIDLQGKAITGPLLRRRERRRLQHARPRALPRAGPRRGTERGEGRGLRRLNAKPGRITWQKNASPVRSKRREAIRRLSRRLAASMSGSRGRRATAMRRASPAIMTSRARRGSAFAISRRSLPRRAASFPIWCT